MKPQASRCYLCGALAVRRCGACGQPICEEQARLGADAKGQKQWLCLPCDERRHQHDTALWGRG